MWIDLYIDGFRVKSWLVDDLPAQAFSQCAHLRREAYWDDKIASCKCEVADLLCTCRHYVVCVRVKSVADCHQVAEEVGQEIGFQDWQIKFIEENAKLLNVKKLARATGLSYHQVYGIKERKNIKVKRSTRKRSPNKIAE